ncbi:hypothetical protein THAOC_22643, partial [Thalassiosira oceanica]
GRGAELGKQTKRAKGEGSPRRRKPGEHWNLPPSSVQESSLTSPPTRKDPRRHDPHKTLPQLAIAKAVPYTVIGWKGQARFAGGALPHALRGDIGPILRRRSAFVSFRRVFPMPA